MHLDFGYTNFKEFCTHELPFSYGHALSFVSFITHCKRLKYNKPEAVELINRIGLSRAIKVICKLKVKKSVSKISKTKKLSKHSTFAMHLSPTETALLERKLLKFGLDINENGRRLNARETMLKLVASA